MRTKLRGSFKKYKKQKNQSLLGTVTIITGTDDLVLAVQL